MGLKFVLIFKKELTMMTLRTDINTNGLNRTSSLITRSIERRTIRVRFIIRLLILKTSLN